MRVAYNKLVRDQIPDIIAAAGSQPSTHVLDHASYRGALRSKLLEEAQEAMEWEDIEVQAKRKRAERGGFDRRIFLEHVDQASRPMPE
jgi:predicted house-cleaning noncanonical NTP pyrophosphatase (MazG superfamily)